MNTTHENPMLDVATIAETRLAAMPANLARAIEDAMLADGYLERFTFNPFATLEASYAWLRREYAQAAIDGLPAA